MRFCNTLLVLLLGLSTTYASGEDVKSLLLQDPVKGWITSGYGYRTSPFNGKKQFHGAMDVAASEGTPIKAPLNGIVQVAGEKSGCSIHLGKCIIIDHGNEVETVYGHLLRILVTPKTKVSTGQTIGHVGSTGLTTGPHLHFELHLKGKSVNPKLYLPR